MKAHICQCLSGSERRNTGILFSPPTIWVPWIKLKPICPASIYTCQSHLASPYFFSGTRDWTRQATELYYQSFLYLHPFFLSFFILFETGSNCVARSSFHFFMVETLLPQPPEFWHYWHEPPCWAPILSTFSSETGFFCVVQVDPKVAL